VGMQQVPSFPRGRTYAQIYPRGRDLPRLASGAEEARRRACGSLFFRENNRLKLAEFGRRMEPLFGRILEHTEAAQSAAEISICSIENRRVSA
jgi:hypothetical protein